MTDESDHIGKVKVGLDEVNEPIDDKVNKPSEEKHNKNGNYNNYNNDSIQLVKNSFERSWGSFNMDDIRVVVGLDFGTTYSGFSYSYVANMDIVTHDCWPDSVGRLKTNTALRYGDNVD
ncbi:unnamed protein product [Rhizophagus irregularis]|nr:unnamed protein product [Rhizophagus irregularis]